LPEKQKPDLKDTRVVNSATAEQFAITNLLQISADDSLRKLKGKTNMVSELASVFLAIRCGS